MKTRILYVERKLGKGVSIEKVFRQIAKSLSKKRFEYSFQQLPFTNDALGTLKNLLFYRKKPGDVYHVTGHVHYICLILPKNRTVLTIHDLVILRIRSGLRRYILKKVLIDWPVKKLKYITTVSEATKKEIVFFTKCEESKIRVIENPIQEHFKLSEPKTFNVACPTVLQIGTTANKNLKNLIKAVNGIKCHLRIIGEIDFETEALLKKYRIAYSNTSNLNNEDIRNEYKNADIVTFCSIFEGFGLPIIEGQAMRTPVLTSNISPMKEVAGDGAVLVNPNDNKEIERGLLSIIESSELREKLVANGLQNIKRFEQQSIAGLYENLYDEITGSGFSGDAV